MRCYKCHKKSIFDYKCKCEHSFCISCISSFVHNCSFDYKNEKRKMLEEQNIKIVSEKVIRI